MEGWEEAELFIPLPDDVEVSLSSRRGASQPNVPEAAAGKIGSWHSLSLFTCSFYLMTVSDIRNSGDQRQVIDAV